MIESFSDGFNLIANWLKGEQTYLTKYLNLAPHEIYMPNELGLPFFYEVRIYKLYIFYIMINKFFHSKFIGLV